MTQPTPTLIVPLNSMNLAIGALRWLNADDGPEASLTMDDIPGQDWDAIIALTSAFLEQARRRRSWHEARNERDGALTAAVATVMGPQPGGGWMSGSCRTAG
jgi:hypothetical protein